MREIKFRAYHFEDKQMLYQGWNGFAYCEQSELLSLGDSAAIMQFTGLKDKNGKEIYEGDIVSIDKKGFYDEGLGVFVWQDFKTSGNDQWMMFKAGWKLDTKCGQVWTGNTIMVIGNIHDNPELLKPITNEPINHQGV